MTKLYEWLVWSSANPEKLSATIKGALIAVVPVLIFLISFIFKIDVSQSEFLGQIDDFCTALGSIVIAFGLIRKMFIFWSKKKAEKYNS